MSTLSPVRISLQNILLATDFSQCSETALSYAVASARRFGATMHTVNVVRQEFSEVQPPDPFYLRHSAQEKMASLVNSGLFEGVKHREWVKEGFILEVLSQLIHTLEIDLLVLGTHGRGGIEKLLLGSVAEEILDSVRCPVLTAGPAVSTQRTPELKLRKIVYATDLLPGSARAFKYALWLAEQEHAHLTLLHVLKRLNDVRMENPEAEKDTAMKRLVQLLPPDNLLAADAELTVETGSPAEHILRVVEDQSADLIVMGSHRTSHAVLSAHLPWVTPHQILGHSRCPVLTVRD